MSSLQDVGPSRNIVNDRTLDKLCVEYALADPEGNQFRPLGEERRRFAHTA